MGAPAASDASRSAAEGAAKLDPTTGLAVGASAVALGGMEMGAAGLAVGAAAVGAAALSGPKDGAPPAFDTANSGLSSGVPERTIQAWQVLMSGVVMLLCCVSVMVFFSQTFDFGDDTMMWLLDQVVGIYTKTVVVFGSAAALLLLLYLLDFSYWKGPFGVLLRRVGVLAIVILVAIGSLLLIDDFPVLPLSVAMLLLPFAALFLRTTLYASNNASDVSCVMGINFVTSALIVLIIWMCWLFGAWTTVNNHWFENRAYFIEAARCYHSEWANETMTTVSDGSTVCLAAFLLWASPLMLFAICIFLGLFLILLSRSLTHADASSTRYAIKFLSMIVGITVFGMYSAVSISGAGMQLSYAAFAMYGVALVATILIWGTVVGWSTLTVKLERNPYLSRLKMLGSPWTDIAHGFFILVSPFYLVFLGLSLINQSLRKVACNCGVCKPLTDDDRKFRVTLIAHRLNNYLAGWSWTNALFYAQLICICMWMYRYASILAAIVFNMLIAILSKMHWALMSALFVAIGLVMFLLPVVPGPMVYLTSGVLVVPTMEAGIGGRPAAAACPPPPGSNITGSASQVEVGTPFLLACVWANLISYGLKLVAHVMQQKMIGETLGSRVSIRAMVNPNSKIMKAAVVLLRQPGITIAKVSIMCGGPDWPTSVICGFLKLPMGNLLLGLTPMFLMTVPTTLTGAFTGSRIPALQNIASFFFLIVLFVQLVFGVGMMHYVNKTLSQHADEVAAIPDDLEVKRLEEYEAQKKDIKAKLTRFQDLPLPMQVLQVAVTTTLVGTFYLLLAIPSDLFQPFQLDQCPDDLGNKPYDFIPSMTLLGFLSLVGFVLSMLLMYIFSKWAEARVNAAFEASKKRTGPPVDSESASGGLGGAQMRGVSSQQCSGTVVSGDPSFSAPPLFSPPDAAPASSRKGGGSGRAAPPPTQFHL